MAGFCRLLIAITILVIVLLPFTALSHAPVVACPQVVVECPDELFEPGKTYIVKAHVTGGDPNQELSYNWSVSSGEIVEGQGTASIKVRNTAGSQSTTATVEVNGLPVDCERTASCTFIVSTADLNQRDSDLFPKTKRPLRLKQPLKFQITN